MTNNINQNNKSNSVAEIILYTIKSRLLLSFAIVSAVVMAIVTSLFPPLILGGIIDAMTAGQAVNWGMILAYFGLIVLTGLMEAAREALLTVFGQKITHALRSGLMDKFTRLTADCLNKQEPGAVVSRFVGDVDTVEALFTSGIISMFADVCRIISILAVIWFRNKGLAIVIVVLLPFLFWFTRHVQKNMLSAQIANRRAVSRASGHVPETLHNIRTVHTLGREKYMEQRYDEYISEGYRAMEKTNFYDAIYSPVILILNAVVIAVVMLFSASGNPAVLTLFGMSAGTAVAVMNYISQIFSPVESLGMEIQTIQSALAGVKRIDEFLAQDGRVMDSMLSEHMCEGWLEGYLLTGRHGFFASYEAFIRVVDSMCAQHAKWLKEAGIDSINVSLDTIDASEYERITKKPLLEEVKHGINAAIECGIRVKINVVLTPQTDVVALTRYASKKGTDIRFIEMMPVGEGHTNGVEPYEKVIGALLEVYGTPCHIDTENREEINSGYNNSDNGPAEYYSFHGLNIRVGLIQAIHGKFCDTCNRIRVTADGRLMPCLGSSVTMDLVPDSCEFTDDLEKDFVIVQALKAAIKAKPGCHNFNDNAVTYTKTTETKTVETKTTELKAAEVNAARNMSRIGG